MNEKTFRKKINPKETYYFSNKLLCYTSIKLPSHKIIANFVYKFSFCFLLYKNYLTNLMKFKSVYSSALLLVLSAFFIYANAWTCPAGYQPLTQAQATQYGSIACSGSVPVTYYRIASGKVMMCSYVNTPPYFPPPNVQPSIIGLARCSKSGNTPAGVPTIYVTTVFTGECDPQCYDCSQSYSNCKRCRAPYPFMFNSYCYSECPDGSLQTASNACTGTNNLIS